MEDGVVVEDVEGRVRDHRGQGDPRLDPSLALEVAGRRIHVDDDPVRSGHDQAVAGEDRPRIVDLAALLLHPLERRKLVDPANVPVLAIDAEKLGVVGHHEHPIARDPRRRNAGDVQLPHALAARQLERDHPAALAERDYLPVGDHRVGVDVGQRGDAGADAGPLQRILPDLPPILVAVGVELAGREAGDHRPLADRGRCRTEHTGDFQRRRLRPVSRAVAFLERVDLIVLADHIDGALSYARGAAQRPAGTHLPHDPACGRVERGDIAEAVGRDDAAVGERDAAAVQGILVPAIGGRLAGPDLGSVAAIERAHRAERVDRIDALARDDRLRRQAGGQTASASRLNRECGAERGAERDMAQRLRRVAAGLRPFGICNRCRQDHRQRCRRRVDLDVGLAGEHRNTVAEHRSLRCPLLENAAAAGRKERRDQQGNSKLLLIDHHLSY